MPQEGSAETAVPGDLGAGTREPVPARRRNPAAFFVELAPLEIMDPPQYRQCVSAILANDNERQQ